MGEGRTLSPKSRTVGHSTKRHKPVKSRRRKQQGTLRVDAYEVRLPTGIDPRQLALALLEQLDGKGKQTRTFGEFAEDWHTRISRTRVEPENERRHFRYLQDIWHLREGELTVAAARIALEKARESGLSASTANKVRSTGRLVIQSAQENGEWGTLNPFAVARRFKEPRRKRAMLSVGEMAMVLAVVGPTNSAVFWTAVLTGMRPGELFALRKVDISLKKKLIHVHRSHGRDQTKTGIEREVPIHADLVPIFEEAFRGPGELIFPSVNGVQRTRNGRLSARLQSALRNAGICVAWRYSCRRGGCGYVEERQEHQTGQHCPKCNFSYWGIGVPPRYTFRDLRHMSASLHRMAGADPLAIKVSLGHASRDVTDDIYTHLSDSYVWAEMNKLRIPRLSLLEVVTS